MLALGFLLWLNTASAEPVGAPELNCLAEAIYYETSGEPLIGQLYVGASILNRQEDPQWPSTICDVVYQPSQYSFTLNKDREVEYPHDYNTSLSIAYFLMAHRDLLDTKVNHYLRCDWRSKVDWWKHMEFLGAIGDHCFYYGY